MLYGFDIGGTKIELAVFDDELKQVWSKRVDTPTDSYQSFLACLVSLVNEADDRFAIKGQIGIGIPGIINEKDKTVYTTNIDAVKNKPLITDLEQAIHRPISMNNDANCFALSEAYYKAFKHYKNVLGVILGTGLGGGLVINHQLVNGADGCGGEIGHVGLSINMLKILGYDIPLVKCGCGLEGCCERYLSGTGFEWLYHHFYHKQLSAKTILERYYNGDNDALAHVDRYLELLAAYLANIMMVTNPEIIVIGGGLSNFDLIYHEVPKRLPKYLLPRMTVPRIEKAKYGDAGGARGAALLCYGRELKCE